MKTNKKRSKIFIFVMLFAFFASNSCVSRGMKLSEQIPSYHPDYDPSKKQVFITGDSLNNIVYSSYLKEESKNLTLIKPATQEKYPEVMTTSKKSGVLLNAEFLTAQEREQNIEGIYAH